MTVSISAILIDSINLNSDSTIIEESVTLLSPLTLIANGTGAGSSLILKMDNTDDETRNTCMMITVQVGNTFLIFDPVALLELLTSCHWS